MNNKKYYPILVVVLIVLTIFRMVIAVKTPLLILPSEEYDDALLYKYSMSISDNNWLGDYNEMTLAKNITYSVFLSACNVFSINYSYAYITLYIISILVLCWALKPKLNNYLLAIVYLFLLYSPILFTVLVSQRVYRNAILPIGTILVFASFIGFYIRKEEIKNIIPWSIIASISLIFFWYIKEDSIWILPFICTISVLCILYWIIKKKWKTFIYLLLICIPFVSLFIFNELYKVRNYNHYGIRVVSDKSNGNFSLMVKDLFLIDDELPDKEGVWISKAALNKAFDESPTFSNLRTFYNSFTAWTNEEGEVGGDLIIWKLRAVMKHMGYYENALKADHFSEKVHNELQQAFAEGRIKKDNKIHLTSQMKGLETEDITNAFKEQVDWYWALTTYTNTGVEFIEQDDVNDMKDYLYENVNNPVFNKDRKIVDYSNTIVSIYKTISPIITIIGVLCFIVYLVINLKQLLNRKVSNIDMLIIMIGILLSFILVLTEVVLFTSFFGQVTIEKYRTYYCASAFPLIQIFKYLSIVGCIQLIINAKKEKKYDK